MELRQGGIEDSNSGARRVDIRRFLSALKSLKARGGGQVSEIRKM